MTILSIPGKMIFQTARITGPRTLQEPAKDTGSCLSRPSSIPVTQSVPIMSNSATETACQTRTNFVLLWAMRRFVPTDGPCRKNAVPKRFVPTDGPCRKNAAPMTTVLQNAAISAGIIPMRLFPTDMMRAPAVQDVTASGIRLCLTTARTNSWNVSMVRPWMPKSANCQSGETLKYNSCKKCLFECSLTACPAYTLCRYEECSERYCAIGCAEGSFDEEAYWSGL